MSTRRPADEFPDAAQWADASPDYLRELVEKSGLSQNAAARQIGVSERAMRYYLSKTDRSSPAPYPVQVVLELLSHRQEQ